MAGYQVSVDFAYGPSVPLRDCEWVFFAKCGCPFGCMHAETISEDEAWRQFYDYAKDRNRARRKGVYSELMPKEKFRSEVLEKLQLSYKCPHVEV